MRVLMVQSRAEERVVETNVPSAARTPSPDVIPSDAYSDDVRDSAQAAVAETDGTSPGNGRTHAEQPPQQQRQQRVERTRKAEQAPVPTELEPKSNWPKR